MSINEEVKELIKEFLGPKEDKNRKLDEHLEKAYRKKENSLTQNIKDKTREFKGILLKNGFNEAEHYAENRLWKWKYYKQIFEDVAFIVNLEPYDDYIEIYYGYASTAFTKMAGNAGSLKRLGVSSEDINIRSKLKYTFGDYETQIEQTVKSFYDKYFGLSKDEILNLAKERKKEFINNINLKLKPIGFKKKANTWTISLNENYMLSFYIEKAGFCDCYRFFYEINNVENKKILMRCHTNSIGYEYKSENYEYNWQCYSELEFDNFFEFIKEEILLPIINVDSSQFKDLIVELNGKNKPRLFIPTNENIKFYNSFNCDSNECTRCYKNN